MSDDSVDRVELEEVMGIPVASAVAVRVLQRLDEEVASAAEIGALMDLDPALATRTIFLANSPYYGLRERVATSARAVPVLGLAGVRTLVTCAAFGLTEDSDGGQVTSIWHHAVATAAAASVVAERVGADREHAFSLGLLHDVGAVLQARRDPQAWRAMSADPHADDPLAVERAAFGCDHPELGARALAAARLPQDVVAAVRVHHHDQPPDPGSLIWTLIAAEAVVERLGHGRPLERARPLEAALRAVGVAERLADDVCLRVERRLEELTHLLDPSR